MAGFEGIGSADHFVRTSPRLSPAAKTDVAPASTPTARMHTGRSSAGGDAVVTTLRPALSCIHVKVPAAAQSDTARAEGATIHRHSYGPVSTAIQVAVTPLVLFWHWGVAPLGRLAGKVVARLHLDGLDRRIAKLSPYAALATFVTPAIALVPVKIGAFELMAHGHHLGGVAAIIAAKIIGTAVVGHLFALTKPKLMQIGWFKKAYDWWTPWKAAIVHRAHDMSEAVMRPMRHMRAYKMSRVTQRAIGRLLHP